MFRSLAAIVVLLVSASSADAWPTLRLRPQVELGAGYDNNIYLDASGLPEQAADGAGAMVSVAPEIATVLTLPGAQQFVASYHALLQHFIAGDVSGETTLRHDAGLLYASPPVYRIKLIVGGAFGQLIQRREAVGWRQLYGTVELRRPIGRSLRASLAYHPIYADYDAGLVASEWAHEARVSGLWVVGGGLQLEASYGVSVGRTEPDIYNSLRQVPIITAWWRPVDLPLELGAGYRATISRLSAQSDALTQVLQEAQMSTGSPGPGPGGPGPGPGPDLEPDPDPIPDPEPVLDRTDILHGIEVYVRAWFWKSLFLHAKYELQIGTTNDETLQSYSRHRVLAGIGGSLSFAYGDDTAPRSRVSSSPVAASPVTSSREPLPSSLPLSTPLQLEIDASDARKVAVVGTFNGWDPNKHLLQRAEGGKWRGSFALPAGEHRYMLWIDGKVVSPPACESWENDGFGGKNCLLYVSPDTRSLKDASVGGESPPD